MTSLEKLPPTPSANINHSPSPVPTPLNARPAHAGCSSCVGAETCSSRSCGEQVGSCSGAAGSGPVSQCLTCLRQDHEPQHHPTERVLCFLIIFFFLF